MFTLCHCNILTTLKEIKQVLYLRTIKSNFIYKNYNQPTKVEIWGKKIIFRVLVGDKNFKIY